MQTTEGMILIKLFPKDAPISVANFEKLVNKGFYNGLKFHRIADLEGRKVLAWAISFKVAHRSQRRCLLMIHLWEAADQAIHSRANSEITVLITHSSTLLVLSQWARSGTATSGFDTEGSQFYLCTSPAPHLDGGYAVFGMIIKGLDVAKKLHVGDAMTKVTMVK